jgi:hypothetical protein
MFGEMSYLYLGLCLILVMVEDNSSFLPEALTVLISLGNLLPLSMTNVGDCI